MARDAEGLPDRDEAEEQEPEDTLLEHQKVRIILAIVLLGALIVLVVFVNVPAIRASAGASLMKSDWQLVSYADTGGSMVMVPSSPVITARFMQNGIVAGQSGCNYYSANYTTQEYGIVVADRVRTDMLCPVPEVMTRETSYLSNLVLSKEFRVSDTRLTLFGADGNPLLVFTPVP